MSCDSPRYGIWTQVPDGSKLEVSVTLAANSAGTAFVANAYCDVDQGTDEEWVHGDLVPGPKEKALVSPRMYGIRINALFADTKQTTVEVEARVIEPNGQTKEPRFCHQLSGTTGDTDFVRLMIATKT